MAERRNLEEHKESCCELCEQIENLQVHHIRPIALGGSNHPDNLQTLCKSCHLMVHKWLHIPCPRREKVFAVNQAGGRRVRNNPAGLRRIGVNVRKVKHDLEEKREPKFPPGVKVNDDACL